jgi:cysteine desulfurase
MNTYLDHAATSPLRPEVAAAMADVRAQELGNPTGSHPRAQRARRLLEEARDEVAALLGRDPGEVVFTSGGTEAANLAVLGTLGAALHSGQEAVVLASAVEHPAVYESCRAAARDGADVLELPVDGAGVVDLDALAAALSSRCTLLAVMTANNETGVVQPIGAVIEAVRQRVPNAAVFTDAVQAAAFLDLAEVSAGADMVAISAHKLGGPVGVGALAVGPSVAFEARQHGG